MGADDSGYTLHTVSQSAPAVVPSVHSALIRARWFVIQTGLITTGLALFGVYVLANRINDMHVMTLYVFRWLPAGPIVISVIAASGYALGAWWSGVRVRGGLLLTVILLQLAAYFTAQYTEFSSLSLRYPDTGEPVGFAAYFHHITMLLMAYLHENVPVQRSGWGYLLRGVEAMFFALAGLGSALVLVGQPTCPGCRGMLQRRRLATLSSSAADDALTRLRDLARAGNAMQFQSAVRLYDEGEGAPPADDPPVDVFLQRCKACGNGYLEVEAARMQGFPVVSSDRTDVSNEFAAAMIKSPPITSAVAAAAG